MPIDPLFFMIQKLRDRHVRALQLVDAACDEDGPPVVKSERLMREKMASGGLIMRQDKYALASRRNSYVVPHFLLELTCAQRSKILD